MRAFIATLKCVDSDSPAGHPEVITLPIVAADEAEATIRAVKEARKLVVYRVVKVAPQEPDSEQSSIGSLPE